MAGDDLQLFDGLAHQLGAAGGDIAVRGAVEAVAADAVLLVIIIGDRVHIGLSGHGLVESSVEHGDHRDVAHNGLAGVDAGDVGGVVQRSEGDALFDRLHDLVVDQHGGGKLLAAVDDAVTDGVNLLHRAYNAVFLARQLVDDSGDRLGVRGHGDVFVEDRLVAYERAVLEMAVDADALAKALGHDGFALHVDQLIFQRGAACVDDENFHVV